MVDATGPLYFRPLPPDPAGRSRDNPAMAATRLGVRPGAALLIPSLFLSSFLALTHQAGAAPAGRDDIRRPRGVPELRRCGQVEDARCGSLRVFLDRNDHRVGKIPIAFELYPRRERSKASLGTIVAVEGGPGYSTTGSRDYFLDLFRPLMDRRDLLLVDNRGAGKSGAIKCEPLQSNKGNYVAAVGRCGRQLGDTADLYGTANATDDLVQVMDHLEIDKIDLYGDSYGSFFAQTFAVRHSDRLRSLVLDAAYFVASKDPFFSDTSGAIEDAFRYACQRSPACAKRPGNTLDRIERLTKRLRRKPIVGQAPDADGRIGKVKLGVGGLIYLLTDAATSPTIYRELDAAMRAVFRKRPYRRPLLRLARETFYKGGAGPVRSYSEGLYVAVACNDYPQAYDMTAPFEQRRRQYRRALEQLKRESPKIFHPFTIKEWVSSPVSYFRTCLKWPQPGRPDPPVPPNPVFPDTPTLVLSGDLDSLTSPEGAKETAAAFPNSTYVEVKNMVHVSALADFNRCASIIVRRFISILDAGNTTCADRYNENRLVKRFVRTSDGLGWNGWLHRNARVASATVADVIARWLEMTDYQGRGLRGGAFTTTDGPRVRWELNNVRWVEDIAVSGRASWNRATGQIRANVRVTGKKIKAATVVMAWNDWHLHARAIATSTVGQASRTFNFPAP